MMVSEGTEMQQTYPRNPKKKVCTVEMASRCFDNILGHQLRPSAPKDPVRNLLVISHLDLLQLGNSSVLLTLKTRYMCLLHLEFAIEYTAVQLSKSLKSNL